MSQVVEKAKAIIGQWSLLNHPFYQAWSAGTLPPEKLKTYSGEYGTFIRLIAKAWDACAYTEIADTERKHTILWRKFANSLGTEISEVSDLRQVRALNNYFEQSCANKPAILGALLAFEYQQPTTVASKLGGLHTHYSDLRADETYFKIHLDDWDEPAMLLKDIESMDKNLQAEALVSVESACMLLWSALSGIYDCESVAA